MKSVTEKFNGEILIMGYNFEKYNGKIPFFDNCDVYYYDEDYGRSCFSGNMLTQRIFRMPVEQVNERSLYNLRYIPNTSIEIDRYIKEGNYFYLRTVPYSKEDN